MNPVPEYSCFPLPVPMACPDALMGLSFPSHGHQDLFEDLHHTPAMTCPNHSVEAQPRCKQSPLFRLLESILLHKPSRKGHFCPGQEGSGPEPPSPSWGRECLEPRVAQIGASQQLPVQIWLHPAPSAEPAPVPILHPWPAAPKQLGSVTPMAPKSTRSGGDGHQLHPPADAHRKG